jgi:hypothetical protein
MERTKSEGTFALDFELNQQPWNDPYSGGPTRTPGDIAVGFELQGNPTDPQTDLKVLIVVFDPNGELDNNVCSVTYGNGNKLEAVEKGTDACPAYGATGWYYRFLANAAILAGSDYGAGTMNDEVVLISDGAPAGYVTYDSQGNDDGEIGEFEFAEAAINLSRWART